MKPTRVARSSAARSVGRSRDGGAPSCDGIEQARRVARGLVFAAREAGRRRETPSCARRCSRCRRARARSAATRPRRRPAAANDRTSAVTPAMYDPSPPGEHDRHRARSRASSSAAASSSAMECVSTTRTPGRRARSASRSARAFVVAREPSRSAVHDDDDARHAVRCSYHADIPCGRKTSYLQRHEARIRVGGSLSRARSP